MGKRKPRSKLIDILNRLVLTQNDRQDLEYYINEGKGGGKVDVDNQMSDTSDNPVANNTIKEYIDDRTEYVSYDFTSEGNIVPLYLPFNPDDNFDLGEFIENAIAEGKFSEEDMIKNYNILGSKLNIINKNSFKIGTPEGLLFLFSDENNVGLAITVSSGYPIYGINILTEDNKTIVLLQNVYDIGYLLSLPYSEENIKNIAFFFLCIALVTVLNLGILPMIDIVIPGDEVDIELGILNIISKNALIGNSNNKSIIFKTDTHYIYYSEKGLVYFKHYNNYVNVNELTNIQREAIPYIIEYYYELHNVGVEDKAADLAINAVFSKTDIAPATYERYGAIVKFHSYRTNESNLLEYNVYTLDFNGNLELISTNIIQGGGGVGIRSFKSTNSTTDKEWNKETISLFLEGKVNIVCPYPIPNGVLPDGTSIDLMPNTHIYQDGTHQFWFTEQHPFGGHTNYLITIQPDGTYDDDVEKYGPDTELSDTSKNTVQNKAIKKYIDDRQSSNIYTINIPIDEELTQEQLDYNKNLYELIAASPGNPPVIMYSGYNALVEYTSSESYADCLISMDVGLGTILIDFVLNSDGTIDDLDITELLRFVSITRQQDMLEYITFIDYYIASDIYPTYLVETSYVPCHILGFNDSYIIFECNTMLSSIQFTISKEDGSIIKTEIIKARRPIHIGFDDKPLTEEQKAENLKTLEYYKNDVCDVYIGSFRYTENGIVKEAELICYPTTYNKNLNRFEFNVLGIKTFVSIDDAGNATFSEATSYNATIKINNESEEVIKDNKRAFGALAISSISTLQNLSVFDYNINDYVIVGSFDRVRENNKVTKIKFSIIQPNYPTGDNNEGSLKCLWYVLNNDGTVREATANDFIITT